MDSAGTAFRLLLVEDNPGDAELARERLTSFPDYAFDIKVVSRLSEAIAALESSSVDAVILDLNLPDSTGLASLKRLREIHKEMAIIVLSGADDEELRRQALAEGAQEFLSKNEPASRLVARSFLYALERHRIQEQHRQIERLIAANPDAVIVVDGQGVVRFANNAALALFGKNENELVGRPLPYPIGDAGVSEIAFERDEKLCSAEIRAAAFEWNHERAYLASIRDTTETKLLAEQLLQSQKMEALGRLAGGVAHDFNNLLTVIVNCATFLADAIPETDRKRHDVKQILGASERAEALVSQLLALTRKKSIEPRVIDLKLSIESIVALLGRTLPAKIEIVTRLETVPPVLADKGQMEQVLMNLAVNAKDAMPDGGRLMIALETAAGGRVQLSVSDTGCGIPPDVLAKVFDPFFTTKQAGKGTGLGLATCYAIVDQAGGKIGITSEPGAGTTVSIILPGVPGSVAGAQEDAEEPSDSIRGHETILVADDDSPVLASISELLRKHGYTVLTAGDGEEALRVVEEKQGQIDLVLSDVGMPKMGGRQLARALAAKSPGLNLLLMSAFAGETDETEEPHAEIIAKPFRPNALVRKVRATLDRGRVRRA
ncbi:MAG: response regulator [Alphaproteobacteria bacterium]